MCAKQLYSNVRIYLLYGAFVEYVLDSAYF